MKYLIALTVLASLSISPLYAKHDKSQLPPGLQKKAAKNKQLPPGWQKKLQKGNILDKEVYQQSQIVAPINPLGIVTIRIDDRVIRLYKETRKIVDILK